MATDHAYSATERDKGARGFYIALVSGALALATTKAIVSVAGDWLWIASPSWIGYYAALRFIYRRWAWTWHIGRHRLVHVPDLRGTWLGTVCVTEKTDGGDLDGFPTNVQQLCVITISQTLYSISIQLTTERSRSRSDSAIVTLDTATGMATIRYTYEARPAISTNQLWKHQGVAEMAQRRIPPRLAAPPAPQGRWDRTVRWWRKTFGHDPGLLPMTLEGEYFTDRPHHNGLLSVAHVSSRCLLLDEVDLDAVPPWVHQRYRTPFTTYAAAREAQMLGQADTPAMAPDERTPADADPEGHDPGAGDAPTD